MKHVLHSATMIKEFEMILRRNMFHNIDKLMKSDDYTLVSNGLPVAGLRTQSYQNVYVVLAEPIWD